MLPRGRWLQFALLSVLVHLALLPFVSLGPVEPPRGRPHAVTFLSGRSPKAHRARATSEEIRHEEAKPARKDKPEDQLSGQVVELPPTLDDAAPQNARYLSEHNTKTERETRSRHQVAHLAEALNEPSLAQLVPTPKAKREASERQDAVALEAPTQARRDRLMLAVDPEVGQFQNQLAELAITGNSTRWRLSLPGSAESEEAQAGEDSEAGPTAPVPSVGVLSRVIGAPVNDALEDVEEGEGTFLNSREFKYASFFNRLKRGVSHYWNPVLHLRYRDPSGNIYGHRTRVTVLSVTLAADGSLKDVAVERSSGVDFLDDAALLAFRQAQPFPNPPAGLIGNDGDVRFPFGFHLGFSRGPVIQMPF